MKKRLLRHVWQHGISSAKGHHRRFAEEDSFVKERGSPAFPRSDRDNWYEPQDKPNDCDIDCMRQRWPSVFRRFRGVAQHGFVNRVVMTADDIEFFFPKSAAHQPDYAGAEN